MKNKYVVNTIGRDGLYHLISCANVLHCENPLKVEEDWIDAAVIHTQLENNRRASRS